MAITNVTLLEETYRSNHPAYNAVLVTLMTLLSFVIILGNFLVIATFLKTESLRRPTYYLLSSLAFVDFLTGAINVPLITFQRLVLKDYTCIYASSKIFFAPVYFFAGNSLLHIVMVTWDRYIAVNRPFQYETLITPQRIAAGIVVSWAICLIFIIGLVAKPEDPEVIGNYCADANNQTDLLTRVGILLIIIAIASSGITLVTLNVKILRTAMGHARRIAQMERAVGGQSDTMSRVKASQVVTAITLAFLICYIPTSIFHIVAAMDLEGHLYSRPFDDVTMYIFLCASAINPIIYCYRDRTFRGNALKYFKDRGVWKNLCSRNPTFLQTAT